MSAFGGEAEVARTAESVQVIQPGKTYIGKQGFSYGAGASTETVGARQVCMNVLPMPPGANGSGDAKNACLRVSERPSFPRGKELEWNYNE
jgi:uncharacterized RmlC-like cupin family protein